MMSAVTMGANREPRRWVDESGRVRVIEGWHPSRPSRLGYNLLVDGDWVGTFDSSDDAAGSASVVLGIDTVPDLYPDHRGPGARSAETRLRLVKPDDDHGVRG